MKEEWFKELLHGYRRRIYKNRDKESNKDVGPKMETVMK